MFLNIKLSTIFKLFFIIVVIIMIILFSISVYRIFSKTTLAGNKINANNSEVVELTANNYTNALKTVHENLDSYIGKKIHFTGYVYRIFDFTDNQFVLARNMLINPENQAVVVGFLCNYDNAKEYESNTWIEITGTITKGNYHGEIPVIEINEIKQVECPSDEFVYPPKEGFVPTNAII